jgi:hypothetical protein
MPVGLKPGRRSEGEDARRRLVTSSSRASRLGSKLDPEARTKRNGRVKTSGPARAQEPDRSRCDEFEEM